MRGLLNEINDSTDPLGKAAVLLKDAGLAPHALSGGGSDYLTVYATLSASRGPQNEAVVIAAPWELQAGNNTGGLAVLAGLARSLSRWSFLHKNIIFVASKNASQLEEYVNAYHTSLQHTAGELAGAIVLEYPSLSEHFEAVEVGGEGANGQLPNLDVVNVAVHSARAEFTIPQVLGTRSEFGNGYFDRLKVLTKHICEQAGAGVLPSSSSGATMAFKDTRTSAISLRAVFGDRNIYDITTFGRVCESTVRSINNLHEQFHQSFFFYLLLGTNAFVSIGTYLPAGMLLASCFTLMSLYNSFRAAQRLHPASAATAVVTALVLMLLCAATGHLLASNGSILLGVCVVLLLGVLGAVFKLFRAPQQRRALYAAQLSLAGITLTALSVTNFSLAFIMGLLMAPLAWIRPGGRWLGSNAALLLIACPPLAIGALSNAVLHVGTIALFRNAAEAYASSGVWTWMVLFGAWVPLWLSAVVSC